jgi:hypothetical protein
MYLSSSAPPLVWSESGDITFSADENSRCLFELRLQHIFHRVDKMPQSRNVDINSIPPDAG